MLSNKKYCSKKVVSGILLVMQPRTIKQFPIPTTIMEFELVKRLEMQPPHIPWMRTITL